MVGDDPESFADLDGHDPGDGGIIDTLIEVTTEEVDKVAGPLIESAKDSGPLGPAIATGLVLGTATYVLIDSFTLRNNSEANLIMEEQKAINDNYIRNDFSKKTKKEIDKKNADENGDKNKCSDCKKDVKPSQSKKGVPTREDQLQRHHKKFQKDGGSNDASNGEVLCPTCHKKKHKKPKQPPALPTTPQQGDSAQ